MYCFICERFTDHVAASCPRRRPTLVARLLKWWA